MRIVNSVLGDASGGRWRVVCAYSRLLRRHGHSVLMLLNSRHIPDLNLIPEGIPVETVRTRGHYDYPASWVARRRLRRFAPELAIAHCSRSVALLKRALEGVVPVVAVSHSNKVRRLLPADAYLPLTAHIQHLFQQSRGDLNRPNFVIPNMIAIDEGCRLAPRRVNEPLRLGALGRFDRVKGFDLFIEALGLIKAAGLPFQAVLGGSGAETQRLKAQAQRLGLEDRIEFPGWVKQVERFLSDIDILCVPARSDAFGLTPLEAAAAGVPLVLSRATGHCEMFEEEEEALFCNRDDPATAAEQMQRLMVDDALAERLRQSAFQRVKSTYSENAVADKLLQAIVYINKNFNN